LVEFLVLGSLGGRWKDYLERRATELPEGVLSCLQRIEGLDQKAQGSKALLNVLRTAIV
jgi:hypothetical protein